MKGSQKAIYRRQLDKHMIPFWPDPYPDELLYSVIARYGKRLRIRHYRTLPRQLFGYRSARAMIDLPYRLSYLTTKIPGEYHKQPERIASEMTLLPLHMPFLRLQLGQKLRESMIDRLQGASPVPAINSRRCIRNRSLRFCPACWKEQEKTMGERYWCRVHQAFGCLVCHVHKIPIWESPVSCFFRPSLQLFVDASSIELSHCRPLDLAIAGPVVTLAEDLHWLLNHNRFYPGAEALRLAYFAALRTKGLTQTTSIRIEEVRSQIVCSTSARLLSILASGLDEGRPDWLTQILRASRTGCSSQPAVRHLLLIHALGQRAAIFFRAMQQPSELSDRSPGRHAKGKLLTPKRETSYLIRSWWLDKAVSVNEMARRLGSDPQRVNLAAAKLGLPFPRLGRWGNAMNVGGQGLKGIRKNHRILFLGLRRKYPEAGLTTLNTLGGRVVKWLRRHDWAWLQVHKPPPQRRGGAPSLNWNERDQMLASRIPSFVAKLRGEGAKVSVSAIERGLQLRIGNMRRKLPKTNMLLGKFCKLQKPFRGGSSQRIGMTRKIKLSLHVLRVDRIGNMHIDSRNWLLEELMEVQSKLRRKPS